MKTAQQHAQEILPLVTAQASGEVIQMYVGGEWSDCKEPTAFVNGCKYRVKPRTILVNGFEVTEPMREAPTQGERYYLPLVSSRCFYDHARWDGDFTDTMILGRGICHSTKEAAIAHAKAMIGINPNS